MGFTNRGKLRALEKFVRGGDTYYIALVTDTTVDPDINTLSELSEIAAGNGYATGGISVVGNATDFDVLVEDDANDRAYAQLKDIIFTASGGNLPASGGGAESAVMTDDNVTVGSREVLVAASLGAARTVSDGQTLTLVDMEYRFNEAA